MKRVHRALLAATTALAVIVAPAAAATRPAEPSRDGLQQRLDEVVDAGAVGALAEVRDGDRVWRGSSGLAELGKSRGAPTHGRFRAGSITKTFVATVVLQLADKDRLRLDDTVDRWLPGAVPDGDRITVRELLNHTSGLYDVVATLPMPPSREFFANRWRTWTAAELVRRAVAHVPTDPEQPPPGSEFAYSSTGYLLLGEIIHEVTGHSYADEIEHRIIRPLHLHGTSLPGTFPRIRGPHPHGYVPTRKDHEDPGLLDYTEMNPSIFGAGGELISTTRDLNRFFAALLDGRLLPDRLLDEMKTPGVEGARYGLGLAFWQDTSCGVPVYGHDGDALTYQSWSYSTEDGSRQVTVALTPDFHGEPDDAVDALVDEALCG
ncbi:MAG: beta-lactamase family protein [Actinomycetia bacterium]|nr:beta-lactamase family protein [Actinomycetes bacterium]